LKGPGGEWRLEDKRRVLKRKPGNGFTRDDRAPERQKKLNEAGSGKPNEQGRIFGITSKM
jgi:hypothetical protein